MKRDLCKIRILVETSCNGRKEVVRRLARIHSDAITVGALIIPFDSILVTANELRLTHSEKQGSIQAEGCLESGYADKQLNPLLIKLLRALKGNDAAEAKECLQEIQRIHAHRRLAFVAVLASIAMLGMAFFFIKEWHLIHTILATAMLLVATAVCAHYISGGKWERRPRTRNDEPS